MKGKPYARIERGTLLIATPHVEQGIFYRSVVIVCEHGPQGSFGIVVNKPLDVELPNDILNMESVTNPRVHIRSGGPVQTNQMMLLHSSASIPQQTMEICRNVYLGGDLTFLQGVLTDQEGPAVNLCFGYAGWGAGQLEKEFLQEHWFLTRATSELIFETAIDRLWVHLLREMGGSYAALSMIPDDLTLN